jgi:signal transduction histidine kinase
MTSSAVRTGSSDFVASISHLLRTPSTSFSATVTCCSTTPSVRCSRRCRGYGASASGHGLQLIRDVLDLSRLDSGRNRSTQPASVPELMAELAAGAQSLQRAGEVCSSSRSTRGSAH